MKSHNQSSTHSQITALVAAALCIAATAGAQQIVTNLPMPIYAGNIALNPALNKIYLAGGNPAAQQMLVVDGDTFSQVGVGTGGSVAVDVVNNNYWSAGVYSGTATVWDSNDVAVMNISLGFCPTGVDVDAPHRRAWAVAQCGSFNDPVWAIDSDTYALIAGPIGSGGVMGQTMVNPATDRFYLNSGGSKRVNPFTFALTANAFGVVIGANAQANLLYAQGPGGVLQILDGAPDPEVVLTDVTLPSPLPGARIGVNPKLNRIYVQNMNAILILDGTTGATIGTVDLGAAVTSVGNIVVDASRNRVYAFAYGVSAYLYVIQDIAPACPVGQGFWKNNPNAWPVSSLTLGSQTYAETELLTILKTPVGSGTKADASLILADQLIAAKLNVANGADAASPSSAIPDADAVLSGFAGKLPYKIKSSSASGQAMTSNATVLNSYNSGLLTRGCLP